ncbi:MAG: CDP-diacylglycerol--glycerol-3-phosphate 3-phosphatidyltransferase [Pirellulaceae bacterium]|jgi:CDP-diacylglycerol--glycerol-3-phosphate 3-phosphatidyltransferase|nr:CDP-diacylglycerol--glycerol-3-phosphate 3-phosphatidyltransferase [Pirellulaceae bacterium]MDP6557527.1 CDP-diacylglycerol--glycerol-3-phosphate 3-phosphatidyltransferase [Pirellulaceae bacterium]
MSDTTQDAPATKIFNVPNQLTAARFVLAIVVFVLIIWQQYFAAMIVFIVAASTDWIDGYWARRFNQVTKIGRVFDPFVDKIIICGTFILLGAEKGSGIEAWMAVVVFGREMLVTALRSFIEQHGGDFSAKMAGKLKMVFQCAAVVVSLWVLKTGPEGTAAWLHWTLIGLAWLAVLSTIQSGLGYVLASAKFFKE